MEQSSRCLNLRIQAGKSSAAQQRDEGFVVSLYNKVPDLQALTPSFSLNLYSPCRHPRPVKTLGYSCLMSVYSSRLLSTCTQLQCLDCRLAKQGSSELCITNIGGFDVRSLYSMMPLNWPPTLRGLVLDPCSTIVAVVSTLEFLAFPR